MRQKNRKGMAEAMPFFFGKMRGFAAIRVTFFGKSL
jgi:hypothetical protein